MFVASSVLKLSKSRSGKSVEAFCDLGVPHVAHPYLVVVFLATYWNVDKLFLVTYIAVKNASLSYCLHFICCCTSKQRRSRSGFGAAQRPHVNRRMLKRKTKAKGGLGTAMAPASLNRNGGENVSLLILLCFIFLVVLYFLSCLSFTLSLLVVDVGVDVRIISAAAKSRGCVALWESSARASCDFPAAVVTPILRCEFSGDKYLLMFMVLLSLMCIFGLALVVLVPVSIVATLVMLYTLLLKRGAVCIHICQQWLSFEERH